ncbi:MAG: HEAT repeat domain-containing protein, partial [Planktothrix sp.]|uniref:HEAT repeat domain-containing protein n=1 Tax=Planktothrix sp. TaxID=3088171 RepID=UPI0038D374DF
VSEIMTEPDVLESPTVSEIMTEPDVLESPTVSKIITKPDVLDPSTVSKIITKPDVLDPATVPEIITKPDVLDPATVPEIITKPDVLDPATVSEIITEPAIVKAEKITLPPGKATSDEQLIDHILAVGTSGNLAAINTLTGYLQHSNSQVRYSLATTLGKLTATHRHNREVQKMIPILTHLSQDLDPRVRQEAIIALGNIPSHQVIPILQKGLRDTQSSVVKSASLALSKFKVYRVRPKSQPKTIIVKKANSSQ